MEGEGGGSQEEELRTRASELARGAFKQRRPTILRCQETWSAIPFGLLNIQSDLC